MTSLEEEIRTAINRACAERTSDTPDFVLAEYLIICLSAFDHATIARGEWHKQRAIIKHIAVDCSGCRFEFAPNKNGTPCNSCKRLAHDAYEPEAKEVADKEDIQLCLTCSRLEDNGGSCKPNTNSFVTACEGYTEKTLRPKAERIVK